VVNGMLFARRLNRVTGTVGAACLGDGATSTGAFHEALNQAAVEQLPLVLVVANNQYAYSTPTERQFACHDLVDKAAGYGVESHAVDGTDLTECLHTMSQAVGRARAGGGPQLVVAQLLRLCGHAEHDDGAYVDPQLKNSALGRDCLKVAREILLRRQWADAHQMDEVWREEAVGEIDQAIALVQREPAPDPFAEEWTALSTRHLIEGQE